MTSAPVLIVLMLGAYLARWLYTNDRVTIAADLKTMFLALGVVTVPSLLTGHPEWLLATVPLTPVAFNMIRTFLRPRRST